MAKKAGRAAAEPTAATPVPSRDALQRLSYLYQASVLLNNIDLDSTTRPKKRRKLARTPTREGNGRSSQTKGSVREEEKKGRDQDQDEGIPAEELALEPNYPLPETVYGNNDEVEPVQGGALKPVSQHLVRMMQDVAKKATVRMDPAVKRSVCKSCSSILVPGVSSSVRIKASGPHAHLVVHTCSNCLAQRRFPAPPHLTDTPLERDDNTNVSAPPPIPAESQAKARSMTKRERREAKQARRPVFFERTGHVVVKGGTVVKQDDYGR